MIHWKRTQLLLISYLVSYSGFFFGWGLLTMRFWIKNYLTSTESGSISLYVIEHLETFKTTAWILIGIFGSLMLLATLIYFITWPQKSAPKKKKRTKKKTKKKK